MKKTNKLEKEIDGILTSLLNGDESNADKLEPLTVLYLYRLCSDRINRAEPSLQSVVDVNDLRQAVQDLYDCCDVEALYRLDKSLRIICRGVRDTDSIYIICDIVTTNQRMRYFNE